jgi:hypothetical protein
MPNTSPAMTSRRREWVNLFFIRFPLLYTTA